MTDFELRLAPVGRSKGTDISAKGMGAREDGEENGVIGVERGRGVEKGRGGVEG